MTFNRETEYLKKLFLNAIDEKRVFTDVRIDIIRDYKKAKNRAWCSKVNSWVQFPNSLRKLNTTYFADIIEVPSKTRRTFYRVVKESIRKRIII